MGQELTTDGPFGGDMFLECLNDECMFNVFIFSNLKLAYELLYIYRSPKVTHCHQALN